jgi:divalent metal cation (Fe/Co/Zn/Cd) transporter
MLMDTALDEETQGKIIEIIKNTDSRVTSYHMLKTRTS